MNIILEGCDGTGKSTIAKHLCQMLGLQYWHESQPRTFDEYKQMLEYGGFVFDRFCFGQFVYNSPEQQRMSLEELRTLVREVFPATQTVLILVEAHTEPIIERLIARGEGAEEHRTEMTKWVKNIRGSFKSILHKAEAPYIEINGEGGANYAQQ